MKEIKYYETNPIPYKSLSDFTKEMVTPIMETFTGTKVQIEAKEAELKEAAKIAYREYSNKRSGKDGELITEFKNDLAEEKQYYKSPKTRLTLVKSMGTRSFFRIEFR